MPFCVRFWYGADDVADAAGAIETQSLFPLFEFETEVLEEAGLNVSMVDDFKANPDEEEGWSGVISAPELSRWAERWLDGIGTGDDESFRETFTAFWGTWLPDKSGLPVPTLSDALYRWHVDTLTADLEALFALADSAANRDLPIQWQIDMG